MIFETWEYSLQFRPVLVGWHDIIQSLSWESLYIKEFGRIPFLLPRKERRKGWKETGMVQFWTTEQSACEEQCAVLFKFNLWDTAFVFLHFVSPSYRVVLLFQALMEFVFGAFGLPCSNLVKPIKSFFSWIKFPPKNKYPSDRAPHVKTKCSIQDEREHTHTDKTSN